eukprot:sb/3472571/
MERKIEENESVMREYQDRLDSEQRKAEDRLRSEKDALNQQMIALEKEYTERIEKILVTLDNCEKKREAEIKRHKTEEISYKKLISEKDNDLVTKQRLLDDANTELVEYDKLREHYKELHGEYTKQQMVSVFIFSIHVTHNTIYGHHVTHNTIYGHHVIHNPPNR